MADITDFFFQILCHAANGLTKNLATNKNVLVHSPAFDEGGE